MMKQSFRAVLLGALIALTAACQADTDAGKTTPPADSAKPAAPAETVTKAADAVTVENPFARAVPPGQPNSAAFMTLVNTSDVDHSLKSATSPVAATVELHTHTNNNGVMEMRQVEQIAVPAKGRAELKPGGFHIMLIGLKQDLTAGEKAQLTLTFEDGSTTTVDAPIQEVTPPAAGGHMGGMQR